MSSRELDKRHLETVLTQIGNRVDKATGAVSMPVYFSTTYSHPEVGQSTGFDYTRTANPTRSVLENGIAALEGGVRGFAFASGMAAVTCVLTLFEPGQHIVVSDDLYGGTYRVFEQVLKRTGLQTTYVNMSNLEAVEAAIRPNTAALFIETPTNPMMKITDIEGCVKIAKARQILTIVDNTFMTPYCQRPLLLGADVVVHSATKFLGGHNDVLAGLVVVQDEDIAARVAMLQNGVGAVLGPMDAWLLIRGMKTLGLRMERCAENALLIARWLREQKLVTRVFYPALDGHPGRDIHARQATGGGGMVSFEVKDPRFIKPVLDSLELITYGESLGGVESLITYPATQTHADIPKDVRDAVGVTDRLLRFSVGIEHVDDLKADLAQAFGRAERDGR